MIDINRIAVSNILKLLEKRGEKQKDLADGTGIPGKAIKSMLTEAQRIGVSDMRKIAAYLEVSLEMLMTPTIDNTEADPIRNLMERVNSREAREAIQIADEVSDLIVFQRRVREQGSAMMQVVE